MEEEKKAIENNDQNQNHHNEEMEEEQRDEQQRRSFTITKKLEVINYSESHSNKETAKSFNINVK